MINKVIFVGKSGNCRSAMAAALLRDSILKRPIEIEYRGLVVHFEEPINQKVVAIMMSNGIDVSSYASKQLSRDEIDEDTLVLVLEYADVSKTIDLIGDDFAGNVHVLTEVVGEELEIMDPYGAPLAAYGLCYETLSKTIKKLATWLNERETATTSAPEKLEENQE